MRKFMIAAAIPAALALSACGETPSEAEADTSAEAALENDDDAPEPVAAPEAEIARSAAGREVSRMNELVSAEAVPARRLDEARTQLRLADAQLAAARQRRSSVAGGGGGVPIIAPMSGEVLESSLVQGKGVQGGEQLRAWCLPTCKRVSSQLALAAIR
jgi:cobalt-zinc-cadmium efflux system membrane fusion protein